MKKMLVTTAAIAALALAAPAYAQVAGDVAGTVTGQAQVQGQVDPQDVTDPLAQTQEEAEDAVRGEVAEAQEALPQADASVSAETEVATPSAEAEASAEMTTPPAASAEAATAMTAQADIQEELPMQVQQTVNEGDYTTDDLNRAQLAALQAPIAGTR